MIKNFETVCSTARYAKSMEEDAELVLNILLENGGRMRAKEIAEATNSNFWSYQRAYHSLVWLMGLGMVKRILENGEPITITEENFVPCYNDGKPEIVVIDGVEYRRKSQAYKVDWKTTERTITPKIAYFEIVL